MPVRLGKRKGRFVVRDKKGKIYGRHKSRAKAVRQVRAINMSIKGISKRRKRRK